MVVLFQILFIYFYFYFFFGGAIVLVMWIQVKEMESGYQTKPTIQLEQSHFKEKEKRKGGNLQ